MSSNHVETNNATPANGRAKRPMTGRVVPAIPLALGKSRTSKQQHHKAGVDSFNRKNNSINDGSNHQHSHTTADVEEKSAEFGQDTSHGSKATRQEEGIEGTIWQEGPTSAVPDAKVQSQHPGTSAASESTVNRDIQLPTSPGSEAINSFPTVTTNSETVRKPTDRSNVRQIRTELPPAFIPSSEQHTPQSVASSNHSRPQLPARPLTRPHHPSFSSIVFGERESRTASPSPMQPIQQAAERIYNQSQQAALPSLASRPDHGQYIPQAQSLQYQQAFHPPQHESFPSVTSLQFNGHSLRSRDGSQSSSAIAFDGQQAVTGIQSPIGPDMFTEEARFTLPDRRGSSAGLLHHGSTNYYSQPPVAPPFQHPDFTANIDNAEALRAHLFNQLGVADFADCQFRILDKQTGFQHYFSGHRIVLSRSFRLLQLMRDQSHQRSTSSEFVITLDNKYLRIPQLLEAIRYLYGGPLPPFDIYRRGEGSVTNEERVQVALQHLVMGIWLQLPAIAQKAGEIAASLLHWDTLPSLLAFATEGGLSQVWSMDESGVERVSTCSSDDSMGRAEPGGPPSYDPQATYLLHRIITFVVHALPADFYLDTSAPQLSTCPRLPASSVGHHSRPSLTDPRLSKIRFGDISADDHQRPSFTTTMISSILVSFPFLLLKPLLEHYDLAGRLGPETVSSITRSVIQEREVRRQKALKEQQSISRDDGLNSYLHHNLYWVETVEPSNMHRTGCRLARKKRGIDTPPSSGNVSERHR